MEWKSSKCGVVSVVCHIVLVVLFNELLALVSVVERCATDALT